MKLNIKEAIQCIEDEDLYKVQYDLKNGAVVLQKMIDERIKAIEHQKRQFCAVCGTDLKGKENTFTLLFGADDFRRKGSFCEMDCLEYFMQNHVKQLQDGSKAVNNTHNTQINDKNNNEINNNNKCL